MFYRVDYVLAVQLAGLACGLLLGGRASRIGAHRVATMYYTVVSVLVVLRAAAFAASLLIAPSLFVVSGAIGDVDGWLFGALFGLAARRPDPRGFLTDGSVLDALRMALAFTFTFAAIGKAFTMPGMTAFFTQSGYSTGFLEFIVIAEAFGALGLLLPWAAPAMLGLSVDMFGAVLTHVHNGDPLNDSTGAIALLIRLIALGLLWTLRARPEGTRRPVPAAAMAVAAAAIICLVIAGAGSVAMRHVAVAPAAGSR